MTDSMIRVDESNGVQKDGERRDGDKMSVRIRQGGEQDACADG